MRSLKQILIVVGQCWLVVAAAYAPVALVAWALIGCAGCSETRVHVQGKRCECCKQGAACSCCSACPGRCCKPR